MPTNHDGPFPTPTSSFLNLEGDGTAPTACAPSIQDIVDKVFYGLRQNRHTGKAYVDIITDGDGTITLPTAFSSRPDDYFNWMWTYDTLRFTIDEVTGHVLMEVY